MESPEKPKLSFAELENKVRNFKDFLISLPDEVFETFNNKKNHFEIDLEKKYPDARNYRIFHEFIGSSENIPTQIREDFPGEDSIELFIDNLTNQK